MVFFAMFAAAAVMSLVALVAVVSAVTNTYTAVSFTGVSWGLLCALAWHYGIAPFYSLLPAWLQ